MKWIFSVVLFCLSLTCFSKPAQAQSSFYFDMSGTLGYLNLNVTSDVPPTLVQYVFGFSMGKLISEMYMIGFTSDYRFINQYSNINLAGNYQGSRWNIISPTLGFLGRGFMVKADYQFLGTYYLANQAVSATGSSSVSYTGPTGFRISALYNFAQTAYVGLTYETNGFKTQHVESDVDLSPKLTAWQLGLTTVVVF